MERYKPDTLIEKLADDSPLSNATLIAIKRCNAKMEEWLKNLGDEVTCLLCGLSIKKEEVSICMEQNPQVNVEKGKISVTRYVFIACDKCLKQLDREGGSLEGWNERDILSWQMEFINMKDTLDFYLTRGEAQKVIAKELYDSGNKT